MTSTPSTSSALIALLICALIVTNLLLWGIIGVGLAASIILGAL